MMRTNWLGYWFSPADARRIVPYRVGIGIVACIWFVSFWPALGVWFGPEGVLSVDSGGKLVAFEGIARWQVWSPLWWTDSLWFYKCWLLLGMALATLVAIGIGARWSVGLLVLWIIAWSNRILWLSSLVEPALIAFVAYLLVEPGPSLMQWTSSTSTPSSRASNSLARAALRLVQTHWWILLAFTLLSQLADVVWWRGDAVWWLAASGRSNLLTIEALRDNAVLVNALTHGMIVLEILALWLIVLRSTRPVGVLLGAMCCVSIGLLADQLLYALLLGAGLLVYAQEFLFASENENSQ